jgi:hypothetical protein
MPRPVRIAVFASLLPACSILDALSGAGDDDDVECPHTVCYDPVETYDTPGATLVSVGPFDARGDIDLAAVAEGGVVLFLFDDETAEDPGHAYLPTSGFMFPLGMLEAVASGDFDDDGMFELGAGRLGTDGTSFFVDQVGFDMSARTATVAGRATHMVADDFDGDGFHDVAVVSETDVVVLFGTGTGFDAVTQTLPVGFNMRGIVSGELDGNSGRDIAVMTASPDAQIQTFHNGGGGAFSPGTPFKPCLDDCPGGGSETEETLLVVAGDFASDGLDDLAVYVSCRSGCSNQYDMIRFLRAQDGGVFERMFEQDMTDFGTNVMTTGQLDDDGTVDIALQNSADPGIMKLLHADYFDGTGSYAEVEVDGPPLGMLVHDLNSDGLGDIVTLRDDVLDVRVSTR